MGIDRGHVLALVLSAMVCLSRIASAQESANDAAAAQALFETGKRLLEDGKAPQACPKLEESLRLDPAIGTRFQLARCYEKIGRNASAWTLYLEVAAASRDKGQKDREKFARQEAARLEPTLSRLTIVVPPEARFHQLEIKRNQVLVGRGQWEQALPVDPGQYQIEVTAPGKKPWVGTVQVRGEGASESMTIPKLADAPAEPKDDASEDPAPNAPVGVDESVSEGRLTPVHWAAVAGAAVGVVALGVGGVFALKAKSKDDESGCKPNGDCADRDALKKNKEARQASGVATVAVIAGGVLAAAGATVFLLTPKERSDVSLELVPAVAPTAAAISLSGRF